MPRYDHSSTEAPRETNHLRARFMLTSMVRSNVLPLNFTIGLSHLAERRRPSLNLRRLGGPRRNAWVLWGGPRRNAWALQHQAARHLGSQAGQQLARLRIVGPQRRHVRCFGNGLTCVSLACP